MVRPFATATVILAATNLAGPVAAHHGWSSYDAATVLTVEAPIETASYAYPHGEITIVSEGKTWRCVLAPPSRMDRRGLAQEMLATGTVVTVVGYPSRVDESEMRVERITVDGQTIELR
ncbi:MAG TPA: DUF6152 family protein [Geminicoccus sp.]|jgi:hypothetical protein|uniref:DUF6152 family protein n=1 Tax=Geminicoccus sp. TaxID=2024832 RepID=UPI002E3175C5|nr:DUF6152 family protein [Geminicoccus sp.]HEX2527088.1 DUF6152 family protein [Geminicoccus sp.]